jgi:hypothetical protein
VNTRLGFDTETFFCRSGRPAAFRTLSRECRLKLNNRSSWRVSITACRANISVMAGGGTVSASMIGMSNVLHWPPEQKGKVAIIATVDYFSIGLFW